MKTNEVNITHLQIVHQKGHIDKIPEYTGIKLLALKNFKISITIPLGMQLNLLYPTWI